MKENKVIELTEESLKNVNGGMNEDQRNDFAIRIMELCDEFHVDLGGVDVFDFIDGKIDESLMEEALYDKAIEFGGAWDNLYNDFFSARR